MIHRNANRIHKVFRCSQLLLGVKLNTSQRRRSLEGLTRLGHGFAPIQELDDDDARLGRGLDQSLIGPRDETNGHDSRQSIVELSPRQLYGLSPA